MPSIINDTKVISSSSDKAKIFAINFAYNSSLDDNGHPILDPTLIISVDVLQNLIP